MAAPGPHTEELLEQLLAEQELLHHVLALAHRCPGPLPPSSLDAVLRGVRRSSAQRLLDAPHRA